MARKLNTVRSRLVLMVLVIQAVLIPPLYLVLDRVITHTVTDNFIDDVRVYSQVFATEFATLAEAGDTEAALELLDVAMMGGHTNYAALLLGDDLVASSLMQDNEIESFREDFEFGDHEDGTYYLSSPVGVESPMTILRLGFDETPVRENLAKIRQTAIYVSLAIVVLTVIGMGIVSSKIVEPLKRLQRASRAISSGDVDVELDSTSDLVEIEDLSADLETMRRDLVGMNERLHQEMAERELAEAERRGMEDYLRQAQRLESLGTLAGGVAHEFNNVLQPIMLYTELALDDVDKHTPASTNLKRVLELAHRAKGLSRQILTFGRREESSEFRPVDLKAVVHEAVTMIRALLPATIDIRTENGVDIGPVNCDPSQIKQLVVNLCNNAYQALQGPEDYITVSLNEVIVSEDSATLGKSLRPGEYVVLTVADTGQGMDEETIRRVFEPFFTTRNVGDGTGLGLSVVHGIVMRHQGEILIESKAGKGTRIRVYLPVAEDETH
ncbi:MAG: ATP-binding protein [Woeseiaceae bacterium]